MKKILLCAAVVFPASGLSYPSLPYGAAGSPAAEHRPTRVSSEPGLSSKLLH